MGAYEQSIQLFLTKAASNSPTPGGGSVAALAAALGASMGAMAANLTAGPKFADVSERMLQTVNMLQTSIEQYETLMERDMQAFGDYMSLLELPKDTEEQKEARAQALEKASLHAAQIPLQLMRHCLEMLQALAPLPDQINPHPLSELAVAVLLTEAALQSAWYTVESNLKGITDMRMEAKFHEEGLLLLTESAQLRLQTLQKIRELM